MPKDSRLASLLRARESGEKDALLARQEVDRVVDERQKIVDALRAKQAKLSAKIRELAGQGRASALQQGDLNRLSALTGYGKRLAKELLEIEQEVGLREEDLKRAKERSAAAEEEFFEARVEKKRIEQLLEGKRQTRRVQDMARDEALQDEMQNLKKGK